MREGPEGKFPVILFIFPPSLLYAMKIVLFYFHSFPPARDFLFPALVWKPKMVGCRVLLPLLLLTAPRCAAQFVDTSGLDEAIRPHVGPAFAAATGTTGKRVLLATRAGALASVQTRTGNAVWRAVVPSGARTPPSLRPALPRARSHPAPPAQSKSCCWPSLALPPQPSRDHRRATCCPRG